MRIKLPSTGWLVLATVFVVLVCFGMSYGWEYYQARAFVMEIESRGASVNTEYRGPKFVVDWAIESKHENYISWLKTDIVYLSNLPRDFNDHDLQLLKSHRNLRSLWLAGTAVSDTGLTALQSCSALSCLSLDETEITDEGLHHLVGLRYLGTLMVNKTKVTDAGMETIAMCPLLEKLYTDVEITDTGLSHLSKARHLKSLLMNKSRVTDIGIVRLAALPDLNHIILNGDQVTDDTLKIVARFPSLGILGLNDTRVTMSGMQWLHRERPKMITGGGPDNYYNPAFTESETVESALNEAAR